MAALAPMVLACLALLQITPERGLASFASPDSGAVSLPELLMEPSRATIETLLDWWGEELPAGALEELRILESVPLNLNTVTREQLESIPGVTPGEAMAFLEFRSRFGRITSVNQLNGVEGVGEDLLRKVRPYVNVPTGRQGILRFFCRGIRRECPSMPEPDDGAMGSPVSARSGFVIVPAPGISAGALYDRDPGEKTQDGFLSGYVEVRDLPFETRLILGDYRVEAGQGLVLWSAAPLRKGMDVVAGVRRSGAGPRPYHSGDEFHFLRGFALDTGLPRLIAPLDLTLFLSRRSLAATVDNSGKVTSFYEEGLFSTETALRKRNALHEDLLGIRLALRESDRFRAGLTYVHAVFDRDFTGGQRWDIKDPRIGISGIDMMGTIGPATLFGECAVSGGSLAFNAGMILEWGRHASVSMMYRGYPADFVSPHAKGFGEGEKTSNERGIYFGWHVPALSWLRIRGFVDTWKSPWRTFFNPLPVSSTELVIGCDVDGPRGTKIMLQFRRKDREQTIAALDPFQREVRETVTCRQDRLRLVANIPVGPGVRACTRMEFGSVNDPLSGTKERGELVSQEISWSISADVTATLHLALFDADSYDARVFESERDLPGTYSSMALYGKGRRWYLVARGRILRAVQVSLKLAATRCDVGSSAALPAPVADDRTLSFQLDVHL